MAETTLKIKKVTQDPADRTRFVLHFNRTLTHHERSKVVEVISDEFLPAEVTGDAAITLHYASREFFTEPLLQERLKKLVGDAEALAVYELTRQLRAEGQATADAEETRRQLEAINWDSE